MKRSVISILLVIVLVMALSVSAFATLLYVSDGSGLLTPQEFADLESRCQGIHDRYGFAPYIVTTDSFNGMSAQYYAAHYYDTQGCDYNGILLLVSLEEGYWYILTNGACAQSISDRQVDAMGEDVVALLRLGDYEEAFSAFLDGSVRYMERTGEPAGERPLISGKQVLIALGAGLVIALIVLAVMVSKMKTVRANPTANYYVRSGSMRLTTSRDIYLYSNVTRTRRAKSNSSGGGGGGGRSRGGSGGRI